MKTKLLLTVLLSFYFCLLSSQVPQGINYQALAGDASGNPIRNTELQVKISILSDTTLPVTVWEELHPLVRTNAYGVFSLIVGKGSRQPASTVSKFGDISWKTSQLYIRTQVYYQSIWKTMGSAKLWSVPYSMVANDLSGAVGKLSVAGTTSAMDEALFEVKNKNGQTVFAVYNEGVRVYVDDGAKSPKGGFAIGGFDNEKGIPVNYFIISPDSARIYVNNASSSKTPKGGFAIGGFDNEKGTTTRDLLTVSDDSIRMYIDNNTKSPKGGFAIGGFDNEKGLNTRDLLTVSDDSIRMYIDNNTKTSKGGFAIGGFDNEKGENKHFLDVSTDATGIVNPSQNRILWYPIKNAFLAGKVLIEKPDSVGENSMAIGYESKAKGQFSQAMGYQAIARGKYSTSIGFQSAANNDNSFAFGQWAMAKSAESYAFGRGAIAEGFRSFAFGSAGVDSLGKKTGVAYAKGDYAFSIGQGSQALNSGAFAIGIGDTARGWGSTAIGYKTLANGSVSTSIGSETQAIGNSSTAMGYRTIASEWASMATGDRTVASGGSSFAGGNLSRATGHADFSFGYNNVASGGQSVALGFNTRATNWFSTATGNHTHAGGNASFAGGKDCEAIGDASFSFGWNGLSSGGGSVTFGHNAKATNFASFATGSETYSSGACSLAGGKFSQALGHNSVSLGDNTKAIGNQSFAMGSNNESHGNSSVSFGSFTKSKSFGSMVIGQYNDTSGVQPDYWLGTDPAFVIGNGTSNTDRKNAFTVLQNSNVGINMVNPQQKLDIAGGNGRVESGFNWLTSSDIRFKKNITTLESSLGKVLNMRGVRFDMIGNEASDDIHGKNIGFIAQELETVVPEVVVTGPDGYKSVAYDKLTAVLTEAIKEQQKQIEKVKWENQQLKSDINELKTLINSLINSRNSGDN